MHAAPARVEDRPRDRLRVELLDGDVELRASASDEVDDDRLEIVRRPEPGRADIRLDLAIREDGHISYWTVSRTLSLAAEAVADDPLGLAALVCHESEGGAFKWRPVRARRSAAGYRGHPLSIPMPLMPSRHEVGKTGQQAIGSPRLLAVGSTGQDRLQESARATELDPRSPARQSACRLRGLVRDCADGFDDTRAMHTANIEANSGCKTRARYCSGTSRGRTLI